MKKINLKIILLVFTVIIINSYTPLALAGPASTNFQLLDYGFGAGGTASSSSTNFMAQGILGEIETASLSSANFLGLPGLTYTLQPNIPAPAFTNPSNYYNKLQLSINQANYPSDTTYAIAVSPASTVVQDSFTQSGSGLADLSTHTAEVGGTWSYWFGTNNAWSIDKTNDIAVSSSSTNSFYQLASASLGDGDFTWDSAIFSRGGPVFRIVGSNNAYYLDLGGGNTGGSSLNRLTNGSSTALAGDPSNYTKGRVRVTGSSPTHIQIRLWNGSTEPSTWLWDIYDNTAGNQTSSGPIGLYAGNGSLAGNGGQIDNLLAVSSPTYVQADGTLGPNPIFQTYGIWQPSANPITIIGLTPGTTYFANVAAKRGNFQQGPFSATANAATINPSFSFSVQTTSQPTPPFSVNIGNITAGSVSTSTDKITATITTNGSNGGLIYLNGTNAGLKTTVANYTINSSSNDLSSFLEGYGARGTTVTQTSGGPMELVSPYNGTGQNVGIIDSNKRTLSDSTQLPVTNGQTTFELKAKAKSTTPSATDYTDTITLIGTGSF